MARPEAEVEVDADLVRALLEEQHPDLAALPIHELASGWDNAIFRLGDELLVRLPRRLMSAVLIEHEQRWLPELAAGLPLAIPVPLRTGVAGCGYPWRWSITAFLPGEVAERRPPSRWLEAARKLGQFQAALHRPAPPDAPRNPYRGVPLEDRSDRLAAGLDALGARVDHARIENAWARLVDAPVWTGPALWLHGDLHPLNLLVDDGRLVGVLDFGDVTAGDPATDLSVAWMLLPPAAWPTFRAAAGSVREVDDDTWRRARGWALALAVAYLASDDDLLAHIGRRTLDAVLDDEP